MTRRLFFALALASTLAALVADGPALRAQAPAEGKALSHADIGEMLKQLGYEVEETKSEAASAWTITLEQKDGERRTLIGIDPQARTLFILSGGFSQAPDPAKGTNEWFRKLLKINHQLAPSYIFMNDFNVFGLSTVTGNHAVTNQVLRERLKTHSKNFDDKLIPLIDELLNQ